MSNKDIHKFHTFAICAYGESPYLGECVESLKGQRFQSDIIITCASENEYVRKVADEYRIPFCVRGGKSSLAQDWNYALKCTKTALVTLAHQDDIYLPDYSRAVMTAYRMSKDPIIIFTDYYELREGKVLTDSALLRVKRLLLSPLVRDYMWDKRLVRRRILSIGSAICCPTVTFIMKRMPENLFSDNMLCNIDWEAWEMLSREKGDFVYWARPEVLHRIHSDSTTERMLRSHDRQNEDLYMFRKFWPGPAAKMIEFLYRSNEKSAHA